MVVVNSSTSTNIGIADMMTRAASIAVLKYILTDVVGTPADGPLHKALKQDFIETIQDMLGLHDKVRPPV